ncbi:MAG: hypothetical protein JO033_17915 [Acidobacteriaceae bacterium]|nr:hypothetical protein [Acidobacteriaceae bacterium]
MRVTLQHGSAHVTRHCLKGFVLLLLFAFAAGTALATAIDVNGTCELGNCATPDTLTASDGTLTTSFNFLFTFGNTDPFSVNGTAVATNSGATAFTLVPVFTATYVGNKAGTNSGNDTLTVDFLQNYQNLGGSSGRAQESFFGEFGGGFAPLTSSALQFFPGPNMLPLLGPISPPPDKFSASSGIQLVGGLGNPVLFDVRFTDTFGAGSAPGALIIASNVPLPPSTVPEPRAWYLCGTGIALLFLSKLRGSRQAELGRD